MLRHARCLYLPSWHTIQLTLILARTGSLACARQAAMWQCNDMRPAHSAEAASSTVCLRTRWLL